MVHHPTSALRVTFASLTVALSLGLGGTAGCAAEEETSVQENDLQAITRGRLESPDREVEPTKMWHGGFQGDLLLGNLLMKGTVDFTVATDTERTDAWVVEDAVPGGPFQQIDVTNGQRLEGLKLPVQFHLGSAVGKRMLKVTNVVYHIESLSVANVPSRYMGIGLGPTSYRRAGELGASFGELLPTPNGGAVSRDDKDEYVFATIGAHMPGHAISFEAGAKVFDNYVNGDGCVGLTYGGNFVKKGQTVPLTLTTPFDIALKRTCFSQRKPGTTYDASGMIINDAEAIMKNIKISPVR